MSTRWPTTRAGPAQAPTRRNFLPPPSPTPPARTGPPWLRRSHSGKRKRPAGRAGRAPARCSSRPLGGPPTGRPVPAVPSTSTPGATTPVRRRHGPTTTDRSGQGPKTVHRVGAHRPIWDPTPGAALCTCLRFSACLCRCISYPTTPHLKPPRTRQIRADFLISHSVQRVLPRPADPRPARVCE